MFWKGKKGDSVNHYATGGGPNGPTIRICSNGTDEKRKCEIEYECKFSI